MIADGAFRDYKPEAIFGIHVISGMQSGHLYYKDGAILNSADHLRIKSTASKYMALPLG